LKVFSRISGLFNVTSSKEITYSIITDKKLLGW